MALIIPNIGKAGIYDPSSGALRGFFSKFDKIILDGDFKMTPQYGGSGMYPIAYTSADRKSKISASGIEIPLGSASTIVGGSQTVAASGTPVQIPMQDEFTISSGGTVTLPASYPVSATATTVYVQGALDGKMFTGVASAPTAGQFANPSASATSITFNTSDAGKTVYVSWTTDSTTGGSVQATASSLPNPQKFIAQAYVQNTEDPNSGLVPITFVVPKCLFNSNWQISQERQKASTAQLDFELMDPGGNNPLWTIYTAAKFAG